jgi:endopeptidase Clp ATP-binding regulatory subunit ClpX
VFLYPKLNPRRLDFRIETQHCNGQPLADFALIAGSGHCHLPRMNGNINLGTNGLLDVAVFELLAIARRGDYSDGVMKPIDEKYPNPKEIEKELGEFLTKKFGSNVKLATPISMTQQAPSDTVEKPVSQPVEVDFDMKPEELIAYLDQFIIKQEAAKSILSTKICTHFNRIRYQRTSEEEIPAMVGSIKNNILMMGPTGVGKTYMVRLIAHKLGVPFVKGDATKFSETGYVGGDVEDLVRDLVREADGDIERAQYGIIYIDEIDKIASAQNLIGADVSRTGVQRALLKPMEETDVDLKVPHDPISMLQEIEQFRKTGQRDSTTLNTKNVLFIMSGAFNGLDKIIKKRLTKQSIGFGAHLGKRYEPSEILSQVKSEDLIGYGFETEFVGRLPVRTVFEKLTETDLLAILKNPNNPIISGKKLDFASYGIDIKFDEQALAVMAASAYDENTGARGLVSAVETALLPFERHLPSTKVKKLAITVAALDNTQQRLDELETLSEPSDNQMEFERISNQEAAAVMAYIGENKSRLSDKYGLVLTPERIDYMAAYYGRRNIDIDGVFAKVRSLYEKTKNIEMQVLKNNGVNIVLEEDAIDYIIRQWLEHPIDEDAVYKKLTTDFVHGLRLVQEKTGRSRFFITRQTLMEPETYISGLLKEDAL